MDQRIFKLLEDVIINSFIMIVDMKILISFPLLNRLMTNGLIFTFFT